MYTESELKDAIDELKNGSHTIQNVSKLAAVYTVLDHISIERGYPTKTGNEATNYGNYYSNDYKADNSNVIGLYGNTEFLRMIKGKKPESVFLLMDELMATLQLVDDALYNCVINRLDDITE